MAGAADASRPAEAGEGAGARAARPWQLRLLEIGAGLGLAALAIALLLQGREPPAPDRELLCSERDAYVRSTLAGLRETLAALEGLSGKAPAATGAGTAPGPAPGAGPDGALPAGCGETR